MHRKIHLNTNYGPATVVNKLVKEDLHAFTRFFVCFDEVN